MIRLTHIITQEKVNWIVRLIGLSLLLFGVSCQRKIREEVTIENDLDLEQVHIDSLLSGFRILEYSKTFTFQSLQCGNYKTTGFYDLILNPFLYQKENRELNSAPGLKFPYLNKTICYCPNAAFKDSIYVEYDVLQNRFYLIDFRKKKKSILKEKFEVSYAVEEFNLYYPKLIVIAVSNIFIYDLKTNEQVGVNALRRKANHYFVGEKEKYSVFDSTKHFGWSSKYFPKDDSSCFIIDFRDLSHTTGYTYILSINPRTGLTTVYDSLKRPEGRDVPISLRYYSKSIGLIYSLGDSICWIGDLNAKPIKSVNLGLKNSEIQVVGAKYILNNGTSMVKNSEIYLDFKILKTKDFSEFKNIRDTVKILSPEKITESYFMEKILFDKYIFIPYKINGSKKTDYMVYDLSQNKLKRVTGDFNLDFVYEDVDTYKSYLYIPNRGIYLSKGTN